MMSSTMTTLRSSATPLPKVFYKGGNQNQKLPKAKKRKSGKRFHQNGYHRRQNKDHPEHNVLLHRLSLPSSSPSPSSGGLLERIGGSVDDGASLEDSDRNWQANSRGLRGGVDNYADMSFSVAPRYTPEPGEVERFLESVIGAPPTPPSPPSGPVYACSVDKPDSSQLDLVKIESPTQLESSLPPPILMSDLYQQRPSLGDAMVPPSTSTLEACRKRLAPVLLASAHARGPGNRLDSEQCLQLLSDDHCRSFFRQAKEMRLQLSSLVSPKTPVNQGWNGSLKRDRVDELDAWVRNTRNRLSSMNTVVSDVPSRRDSDITLVDFTGGRSPPKAPRAMLQPSQASMNSAQGGAPYEVPVRVASPTTEDDFSVVPGSAPLIELVQQATKTFPVPMYTSQPVTETDTSNVSMRQSTGGPSGPEDPSQVLSPTYSSSSRSTDFTQPGTWFKRQGSQYAEIVDVDFEVGDKMFYLSCERQPFRLRMHLHLCSVPVGAVMKNNDADDIQGVIDHHALRWPKKGKLVIQVNPDSERSKTWLPCALESDPLDVTSSVRPGRNTFRFIQLADLSEFVFVLVASPPPREEEWRSWDWASTVVDRARTSPLSDDDAMNGLSEFAHLPVTVRS